MGLACTPKNGFEARCSRARSRLECGALREDRQGAEGQSLVLARTGWIGQMPQDIQLYRATSENIPFICSSTSAETGHTVHSRPYQYYSQPAPREKMAGSWNIQRKGTRMFKRSRTYTTTEGELGKLQQKLELLDDEDVEWAGRGSTWSFRSVFGPDGRPKTQPGNVSSLPHAKANFLASLKRFPAPRFVDIAHVCADLPT